MTSHNSPTSVTSTDQRGVVHTYTYDPVGRLLIDAATDLGRTDQNVDGTVRRIQYAYQDDGKLSTVTSYSAVTGGNIVNQVKYPYDGLPAARCGWWSMTTLA